MEQLFAYSGLIVTLWISLGVYLVAKYYPGYDHIEQFCSELGAKGSPTQTLSPIINNYPLGLLFCFSGWHVIQLELDNVMMVIAGTLIIVHGIGTWVAGYFPMDKDPYTKAPSFDCQVHSWTGFIMLLSLLAAIALVAFSVTDPIISIEFRIYSGATFILAVFFLFKMAKAYKKRHRVGLYQRVSYWIKLIWLSALLIHINT